MINIKIYDGLGQECSCRCVEFQVAREHISWQYDKGEHRYGDNPKELTERLYSSLMSGNEVGIDLKSGTTIRYNQI